MIRALLLVAAIAFASASRAGDTVDARGAEPLRVEIGTTLDTLDKGYDDWHSQYVEGEKKLGDRHTVYGALRGTERFKAKDTEALAGIYYPLAARWTLLAEGNASPTHHILARWSALGQIQYAFDGGWGAHAGVRHASYNEAALNTLLLTGERYWSNYRAAYTRAMTTLAGSGTASSGWLQLARYYGERSSIGANFADGTEIENLGAPLGVVSSHVRSAGLIGRHWLSGNWAVSYEVAKSRQGSFYTRNDFRLGLRRQF